MSANAPTSFKELLDNIQLMFSREFSSSPNFRSLAGNYKGAPRNPTRFPYVSTIPVYERNGGIYNGVINNIRRVRIFAYSHLDKSRSAMRQAMGILDNIQGLFNPHQGDTFIINKQGEETTFEMAFSNISYSQKPMPWKNGFLQYATLDVDFISREPLLTNLLNHNEVQRSFADSKTITDTIYNTYKSYAVELLPEVASFKDLSLTPQTNFPVVFLSLEDAVYSRRFAGIDTYDLLFYVNVLSRAENSPVALDNNMGIIDKAKQILFANCDFGGKAIDYQYRGVDFGQLISPSGLLYGSSLMFTVQTYKDQLPLTNVA